MAFWQAAYLFLIYLCVPYTLFQCALPNLTSKFFQVILVFKRLSSKFLVCSKLWVMLIEFSLSGVASSYLYDRDEETCFPKCNDFAVDLLPSVRSNSILARVCRIEIKRTSDNRRVNNCECLKLLLIPVFSFISMFFLQTVD